MMTEYKKEINITHPEAVSAEQKKEKLIEVAKAIYFLNNECIKLREIKYLLGKQGQADISKEANNKRDMYYKLLRYTYRFLYRARWITVEGYYIQKVDENLMKIYKLNFGSISFYVSEYHFKPIDQDKNADKCIGLFEGLMPMIQGDIIEGMTADKAEKILISFTQCEFSKKYNAYRSDEVIYGKLLDLYKRKGKQIEIKKGRVI